MDKHGETTTLHYTYRDLIEKAALLHDIGKINVPESILLNTGLIAFLKDNIYNLTLSY